MATFSFDVSLCAHLKPSDFIQRGKKNDIFLMKDKATAESLVEL